MIIPDSIPEGVVGPDQRAIIIAHGMRHKELREQFPDQRRVKIVTPAGSVMGFRTDIIVFFDVDPWAPSWYPAQRDAEMMEQWMEESLRCRFADPRAGMPMVFL